MKKIITTAVTFSMVLSMGALSAFAASDNMEGIGDKEINVKAVYNDQVNIPTVYSVDMEWGAMEFTYTETGTKTWNTTTNQYDVDTEAVWTSEGNAITVTNHSNAEVSAEFEFESLADFSEVTGSFSHASLSLAAADKEAVTPEELAGTTELTLNGALDLSVDAMENVGKITVTIE